ncbi:MAG: hypothetical protein ACI9XC_000869 [Gammaproteobacteria bacterium]|jgi:hypothetical protein
MLTGEGSERLAVVAIKNGIDDYISKENLTKTKLANTIYEASQTHQEKLQKRLSFTYQGRVFNKALFYSALDSAINLKNKNARLIIIKCNSHAQNEEAIGIIYKDILISFIAEKIYNFLLNMKLEIKIISMQDKYIALFIINDSHEIIYLPEKICQHMEKIIFKEGEISCEVFINLGVVPLTLDNMDSGKLLNIAINECESLIVSNENAYVIYDKESSQDICTEEKSIASQLIDPENIEFNVMTAIQENRL